MWKCLLFISHSATFVLPIRAAKTLSGVSSAYRLKQVSTHLFYQTGRVACNCSLGFWKIPLVYRVGISFRSPFYPWKRDRCKWLVFVFKYNRYWYKTVTYYSLIGNVNILLLFFLLWSKDSFISFHETFKLTFRRKITVVRRLTDISYNNLYSNNNVQF